MVEKFKVEGMSCNNCKAHVEREILEINGIDEVSTDLTTGEVTVSGNNINANEIKEAVEKAGYLFIG